MNGYSKTSTAIRQFYSFIYEIFCNKCEFFFSNSRNSKENYTRTVKQVIFGGNVCIKFDGELVVIDELGKFEKNCENLKCTVEKAFDSPCNVLASIRLDAVGWMQDLKERDDTRVFFLSEENREDLTALIMNLLEISC